jgi:hypothetical protein
MSLTNRKTVKGDCETCDRTDVELTQMHHNIMMCDTCVADEKAVTERNAHAVQVIADARKQDGQIELKADLFNAGTVSFVELQAAIENNAEIPAERKQYTLMEEVAARIEKLNAAIFSEEAALLAKKNERHALLVNAQNVAAKLHAVEREKFKQYDINYKPVAPKSVKPKVVKTSGKKFDKTALYEAAKKYGVPAPQVQGIVTAQNKSYEDAAKHLAELMGLI